MFFGRRKPRRLYIPTQSRWYLKPRRRSRAALTGGRVPAGWWWRPIALFFKNRMAFLGLLLALAVLVLALASSSYFAIRKIEVLRENFNVDSAAIENEVHQYIGKNMLFFPKRTIVRAVQLKFPEFRSVNVTKTFPDTLQISLENYEIVANLRAYYVLPDPVEPPVEEPSFAELDRAIAELEAKPSDSALAPALISEETLSKAFSLHPEDRPAEKEPEPVEQKGLLNYVGQAILDQSENLELMTIGVRGLTQPVEDRQQLIPPEHMGYLREALGYLNGSVSMTVARAEYYPAAREIHFQVQGGPILWITIEKDYKEQIDKLKTIYEPAELNKEDIRYIDLRIREKVIYCPRRAACDR